MGGSSSKRFFWQKKKKSPVEKAWSQLTALPIKKRKRRKSILSLDKLKKETKPTPLKRLSLGNVRKESIKTADGGGLGKVGEQIKRRLSQDPKKGFGTQHEAVSLSLNLKSRKEENGQKNGAKESKKRLDELVRSIRP